MERLYEFKQTSYFTLLHKDYCELTEEDLIGEHKTDDQVFGFFTIPKPYRKEFEYIKTLTDEESYVSNYTNYLAYCMFKRTTISVEKSEDKTSIKVFSYNKSRRVGEKFFRKDTICHFITYNHKQNCLYTGNVRNYHLKKKSTKLLNKNCWYRKPIVSLIHICNTYFKSMKLNNFEDIELSGLAINTAMKLFLMNIPGIDMTIDGYENIIYKKYLDGIGVKTPNNWKNFDRTYPQITKKIFKKENYKFVDSYMNLHNLKGDKIKRVLHNVEHTSGINTLRFALNFFGTDFILGQPDETIKKIIESHVHFMDWQEFINNYRIRLDDYTKNEIRNCFEIFKLVIIGSLNIHSFTDHIRFKDNLKNLEPVKWKSKNYDEFRDEHFIWSEKVSITKSVKYNRFYYEPFKKFVETPIFDFYPVLLSKFDDYVNESFEQSNCVKTYVDKPDSIIISLRKENSKNRATIEYKIRKYSDVFVLKRVQALGRFNHKLDDSWSQVLCVLDERMSKTLENHLFELPKVEMKSPLKNVMMRVVFLDNSEFTENRKISQVAIFEKEKINQTEIFV